MYNSKPKYEPAQQSLRFTYQGVDMEIHWTEFKDWKEQQTKARLYVSIPDSLEPDFAPIQNLANALGLPSVYTEKGMYPTMDSLWREYNLKQIKVMREIALEALDQFDPDLPASQFKLKYSSKAGCSCGCSPGFIVRTPDVYGGQYWIDEYKEPQKTWQQDQLPGMAVLS